MTRDEILAMKPGRELDKLVESTFFGWKEGMECDGEIGELPISSDGWFCLKCGYQGTWGEDTTHYQQPKPRSTDIAAAWEILKELNKKTYVRVERPTKTGYECFDKWICEIGGGRIYASGKTAPEAVCKVALLAVLEGILDD